MTLVGGRCSLVTYDALGGWKDGRMEGGRTMDAVPVSTGLNSAMRSCEGNCDQPIQAHTHPVGGIGRGI